MNLAGADGAQGSEVLLHGISLVLGESISGKALIQLAHARITGGLGQDGGRRDGQALGVTAYDFLLGQGDVLQPAPVDQ